MNQANNKLDPEEQQIETMLRSQLQRKLDPRIGAAGKRFARHLEIESQRAASPWIRSTWSIGLIGAALAATVMIVATRHTTLAPVFESPRPANLPKVQQALELTGQADVRFRTIDQGIVELPDGSLARKYYQRRLDTIRVVDPKTNDEVIYNRPRDETILVGLQRY